MENRDVQVNKEFVMLEVDETGLFKSLLEYYHWKKGVLLLGVKALGFWLGRTQVSVPMVGYFVMLILS